MMTTATIILVLIAANINALGTLLLAKFKVISQKKHFHISLGCCSYSL